MIVLKLILSTFLTFFILLAQKSVAEETRKITVNLRGVYDSKITITPFNGVRFALPLSVVPEVKAGNNAIFEIPNNLLPGEFLFRFDYRAKESDHPYPSELQLYINREDITVNANPLFLRGDSLTLINDRENIVWMQFTESSDKQRRQIGLLEQLLQAYDQPKSAVWKKAVNEFEKRRLKYNNWIDSISSANNELYVGHLFRFLSIQNVNWKYSPDERLIDQSIRWFDNFDFTDTIVFRSRQMNEFLNAYIGLFGIRSTSIELRDSLFTLAGEIACERASHGHPKVYGWMVDYFYNGYETYNITAGLKMLEAHANNPNCMTSRKMEIARRMEGIKKLVPGSLAPIVNVHDLMDQEVKIDLKSGKKDYQLLVFYDSGCDHCIDLLTELNTWYEFPENKAWFKILSISLDQEPEKWRSMHKAKTYPWIDLYAAGGVNSEVASNYYVLSTPSMYIIDKKGILCNLPNTVQDLNIFLHGNDE